MPKYRVRPGQSVNHNGVIVTEQDEPIEVAKHVAYELRGLLEPVDEEGAFPEVQSSVRQGPGMQEDLREHERLSILELQKDGLKKQLKVVEAQIADVKSKLEENAARAKKGEQKKSEAHKPAAK